MRSTTIAKRNIQRNTVLEAAAKMFAERGFGGTSLGDVAKGLGISRPAVYYYFSSKEEILSSLVDEISVKSRRLIEEIAGRGLAPTAKLHEMTFNQLLFVMRHKLSYMVVVKTEEELVDKTRRLNLAAKKAVFDGFRTVIREGIDAGDFRQMDCSAAALGIIGMCSWCAWWYQPDGRMSDTLLAEQLTQMALASVLESSGTERTRQEISGILAQLENATSRLSDLQKKY